MKQLSVDVLSADRAELGENPLWDERGKRILWTDIDRGHLYEYHPATRETCRIYEGEKVGGFTLQDDGALLLFRVGDIAVMSGDGKVRSLYSFSDAGSTRFNDVIADPEGRVIAGTIGKDHQSGGLFQVDHDGRVTLLFRGTGVSNGMGFSPDRKTFYWTCSTTKQISAFDFDAGRGALSNRRLIYQANETEGIPDGLTVDSTGSIWSARWDGQAIVKHSPDGSVEEIHPMPASRITSLCFWGDELNRIAITSAAVDHPSAESKDGFLFGAKMDVPGRLEFRSKIRS